MPRSSPLPQSRAPGPRGFSLVEALLAATIGLAAVAAIAQALTYQLQVSSRSGSWDAVAAAADRDLAWIRQYARIWKLASGPFTATATATKNSTAPTNSSLVAYTPKSTSSTICSSNGIATQFITDAGSLSATDTTPPRPNPIVISSGVVQPEPIPLPASINTLTLTRTITIPAAGNRVNVRYLLSGASANRIPFDVDASVYIEATSWCDLT